MTEQSCLELDEEIDRLTQRIGRAPRNRSKRVAKLTRQMERLDGRLYLLEAAHTEARWKARKYRWIPIIGKHWAEIEKQRKLQLDSAKAEKKYLKLRLADAKRRNENYENHRLEHHGETIELGALRLQKRQRIVELGHAKAEELRAEGALGYPAPGSRAERAWVAQLGKREYAKRVKEERQERASDFQRRRDEQRRNEEEQGQGRQRDRDEPAEVHNIRPTPPPPTHGWGR